ncbi:CDP-alcohol phosphatidyltransferase [bacterium (Candidatus Blackallbacteria) CG17_big_fil_post_rev_8_21_14_2_50_48_46]|uniref:CDP-alcohol phosphatidyltransferase n=1 Tax=bacterium (Candidatus Blackallbacteria) CG17_big_fil_post_rev_8_21_14_2_50_48_46 TaxID=2014261 RepID=A0A2M7G8L0_9BACT|nr:MAG: CDP-alcohol phosphatidyltransferase [bacterium (Candidatus Blackallbacteria) CG18_big_fil_WC_8_21_14_2_50_49_26]PIW18440.1 MAG: CDP-alcohol phosphatidyltransferase [bacterium (Candidatus Blackallbacteria) CG17_big_fil_post_rev_8_21_14_2_50_48_46]PIW46575.1 MAG: CDP-alcohol phosphatidyltransferase [bacterium (Candidatus Blackallbacteria) CG13_big_fil_rev_8_21_14_2_50_49_14]
MLDAWLRPHIDRPLQAIAEQLEKVGLHANAVTLIGFCLGLAAASALAWRQFGWGLGFFLLNRLLDGLDGALARRLGPTDFGGYLDIVSDFLVYALLVFAMALAQPDSALHASLLLFSFMGTSTTFLAYAILAAKRNLHTQARGPKAFYYLGGLTEGSETLIFFCILFLIPEQFKLLALIFSAMCLLTTFSRMLSAWHSFQSP